MFGRLFNALRGISAEATDAVMDTDAMQNAEIRGATEKMESDLKDAKVNEAKIGGHLKTATRELKALKEKYKLTESAARKALEANDEPQAIKFATSAEAIQQEVNFKQQEVDHFDQALTFQKSEITKITSSLGLVQRETKILESQKAVTKARKTAQSSLTTISGEDSNNALAVLRKQREKVSSEADKLDYMEEQSENEASELSAEAYVNQSSGSSLLDKLKAEQKG
jgi:phage shock protein A